MRRAVSPPRARSRPEDVRQVRPVDQPPGVEQGPLRIVAGGALGDDTVHLLNALEDGRQLSILVRHRHASAARPGPTGTPRREHYRLSAGAPEEPAAILRARSRRPLQSPNRREFAAPRRTPHTAATAPGGGAPRPGGVAGVLRLCPGRRGGRVDLHEASHEDGADAPAPSEVRAGEGVAPTPSGGRAEARPDLPDSGFVVLLFTDIEGSTRLVGALGDERWVGLLADHRALVVEALRGRAACRGPVGGRGIRGRLPVRRLRQPARRGPRRCGRPACPRGAPVAGRLRDPGPDGNPRRRDRPRR